jgi:hypothetical protein
MSTDNFSAEDSLRVIQQMIDRTRRNIYYQSPNFLLWGWAVFFGCIGQFLLKSVFNYEHHYVVWFITIPCTIVTIVFERQKSKRSRVKTYIDESMKFLWAGTGISFFVLTLLFIKIGWLFAFPFHMILYGLGTFVSGRLLQFRPFVIGESSAGYWLQSPSGLTMMLKSCSQQQRSCLVISFPAIC